MEKPCSRVLRKLSGELTIIQYWAERPAPPGCALALRPAGLRGPLRRLLLRRNVLGVRHYRVTCGGRIGSAAVDGRRRTEVLRLGKERAEVADLRDVAHLVLGHQAADLQQRHVSAAWIADGALPLAGTPAVQQVDRPPPDAREILERLLHRARQV